MLNAPQYNNTVKTLDKQKAKEALKSCPDIVQSYVRALENALEGQKRVSIKAIAKIRELSKKK